MTSAQLLLSAISRGSAVIRTMGVGIAVLLAGGCGPQLTEPIGLLSPYDDAQLWAVAPFANESGVSVVDTSRVADLFVQQLQQVRGIDTIPVNRVLSAMRQFKMPSLASPADAMRLIDVLEVDAIVVGTVTAYDPYPPPTLGAAIQLYRMPSGDRGRGLDPRVLTRAPTVEVAPGALGSPGPVAQAAGVFDATNHQTLAWLQDFAQGRSEPGAPFGADIYLVSSELYTQFVSYRLIHDLLDSEQARLTPVAAQASPR